MAVDTEGKGGEGKKAEGVKGTASQHSTPAVHNTGNKKGQELYTRGKKIFIK